MGEIPVVRLAALVLAAGRSSRAGGLNKLLARDGGGRTMIACSVGAALASTADDVIVVLGHQEEAVRVALAAQVADHRLHLVSAASHWLGLSASLHAGIRQARAFGADAAIVCLGDMPLVRPDTIDRLGAGLAAHPASLACIPTLNGRDANPVAWRAAMFDALLDVTGDRGGRDLLRRHGTSLRRIAVDDRGVLEDFDDKARLAEFASLQPDWTSTAIQERPLQ